MKKVFYYIITIVPFFLLNTITVLAQPGSGGGGSLPCDPDEICPLDTWVIALVIIAVIFTVIHLHRKQKSLQV